MPKQVPITLIYGRGNLVEMLDAEYEMVRCNIENLTEVHLQSRPHPMSHAILEIIWHLYYPVEKPQKPTSKSEALARLKGWYEEHRSYAQNPVKLDEPVTWWTGEVMTYRGYLTGFVIRHMAYHLGQIVALRQAIGVDIGRFYHEE